MLHAQHFDAVFLDEAAQCMEAWVWTLLRPSVRRLCMAGDVKQLPAQSSESGRTLRHERSLMERLVVDLQYDNVVTLTEQHRMAPEILRFPNAAFYGDELTTGAGAPTCGKVEWIHINGTEESSGTSVLNRAEAHAAAEMAAAMEEDVILLAPYTAQCRLLLAQGTNREVHTVDSFQGREADVVILSLVRDGTNGLGFWQDPRRLTVALTRARRRLVILSSGDGRFPTDSMLSKFQQSIDS